MIALHHAEASPHSASVRIVLAEKGLDYASHPVDLAAFGQLGPEFLALNPEGQVPVIEDGDARLDQAFLILLFLDERYPEPPLGGADPRARYAVQKWGKYVETHIAPNLAIVRWQHLGGQLPPAARSRLAHLPQARRELWMRAERGFSAEDLASARSALDKAAERLERDLSAAPWLADGRPTLADFAVYPHLAQFGALDVAVPPRVAAWLDRLEEIPSVRAQNARTALMATMGPERGRWG